MAVRTLTLGAIAMVAANASAATFVNGNFEDGTLNGWTQGSGYTAIPTNSLNTNDYLPGGVSYDPAPASIQVTTNGSVDAITGASVVYSGNHAVRVNDALSNNSVNVLSQTVNNYQSNQIVFEWNAVLESSHGLTDSDAFNLQLIDNTSGSTLLSRSFSSASAPGIFNPVGSWYTSGWQVETIDVSQRVGHSFTLSLLATDCPYGGHAGYVYLDGFSDRVIPPGPVTPVPEPMTAGLFGLGMLAFGAKRGWRRPQG